MILTALATGLIIILPFLILDLAKVWSYLVTHQLHRPAGNARAAVWSFFFAREWFVLLTALLGAILSRKWLLLLPVGALVIFFTIYQDLYYLYLGNLFFYLAALAVIGLGMLWQKNKQAAVFLLLGLAASTAGSILTYETGFRSHGRFSNAREVAAAVEALPDNFALYGSHEVAPLIALLSRRSLFQNFIDTNAQTFASGAQNREAASAAAAKEGVFLLARITDAPEYGIKDLGYDSFFSKEIFATACQRVKEFASPSRERDNLIVIYRCKN